MCFAHLRATTACNLSSLISPDGSAPAALASLLFDPPEPQIIGKTLCFATFLPCPAPASSFLLTLSILWSSLFFSSLTLPTSAFPSVHIVGSLTSKLPSTSSFSSHSAFQTNIQSRIIFMVCEVCVSWCPLCFPVVKSQARFVLFFLSGTASNSATSAWCCQHTRCTPNCSCAQGVSLSDLRQGVSLPPPGAQQCWN